MSKGNALDLDEHRIIEGTGCQTAIPLAEIFASISGEAGGLFGIGARCVFLRLSGCNVRCTWCDTEPTQDADFGELFTLTDIANAVYEKMEAHHTYNLVITGGEPLLYLEQVKIIIRMLRAKFRHDLLVQIETNGSLNWDGWAEFGSMVGIVADIKLFSADVRQDGYVINTELFNSLRSVDVVKLVCKGSPDIKEAVKILESTVISDRAYICLSVESKEDAGRAMHLLDDLGRYRTGINVQMHKWLELE